jgi:hypothetical protein
VEQAIWTTLEALSHATVPFEHIAKASRPVRSPSYTPVFQVQLSVHSAPVQPLALPSLTVAPILLDPGTAKADLMDPLWPRHL